MRADKEKQFRAILKEYSTLREEILVWTRSKFTVITASLTVITALIGYSITSGNYVILPFLLFFT